MTWFPIHQQFDPSKFDAMLALTYEFDDVQLSFIFGENSPDVYEKILTKKPVIIYEGSKTKEFSNLPPFIELHPLPPGRGIHHSKAYLLIRHSSIVLMLGSFNLTVAGFNRNRESFIQLEWTRNNLKNIHILDDFLELIKRYYLSNNTEGFKHLHDIINSVELKSGGWKKRYKGEPKKGDCFLLYSGYKGMQKESGLEELKRIWNDYISERPAGRMLVVSPFFDQDAEKKILLEEFVKENVVKRTTVLQFVSARNNKEKCPFSELFYNKLKQTCPNLNTYLCTVRVDNENKEWEEICKINDHQQTGRNVRNEVFDRPLHAKILVLSDQSGQNSIIYTGSANFTKNAWLGKNQELGLILIERDHSFDEIVKQVTQMLSAKKTTFNHLEFSPTTPLAEDDIQIEAHYPSFAESIMLERLEDEFVCFKMKIRSEKTDFLLNDYRMQWGDQTLKWKRDNATTYQSCKIANEDAVKAIITARNIKFIWLNDETVCYYLPYLYTDTIMENRLKCICPNSDFWIQYNLLGLKSLMGKVWDMTQPEEHAEEDELFHLDSSVLREKNPTINMQRFISFLPRLENVWENEIEQTIKYANEEITFEDIWSEDSLFNIAALYRLVKDELENVSELMPASFFKISELLMLMGRINASCFHQEKFETIRIRLQELVQLEIKELTDFLKRKKLEEKTPFKEYFNDIVLKGLN